MVGEVEGRRQRERPRMSWFNNIKDCMGASHMERLVEYRAGLRRLTKASYGQRLSQMGDQW
eukprot:gene111-722_t